MSKTRYYLMLGYADIKDAFKDYDLTKIIISAAVYKNERLISEHNASYFHLCLDKDEDGLFSNFLCWSQFDTVEDCDDTDWWRGEVGSEEDSKCSDEHDNDCDGLVDCEDDECYSYCGKCDAGFGVWIDAGACSGSNLLCDSGTLVQQCGECDRGIGSPCTRSGTLICEPGTNKCVECVDKNNECPSFSDDCPLTKRFCDNYICTNDC